MDGVMTPEALTENAGLVPVERCNLCGATARTPQREVIDHLGGDGKIFQLVKCGSCGLIYVDPRPPDEQLYRYYGQEYYPAAPAASQAGLARRLYQAVESALRHGVYGYPGASGPAWTRSRPLLSLEKLLFWLIGRDTNLIPFVSGGRLLDVGCGTGEALAAFRDLGWRVSGVEPSEYGAKHAREVHGIDVFTGDLLSAQLEPASFDVICFSNTLEHMSDPMAILRETYRLLAPGGLVVVRVPNADSLEIRFFGSEWFAWEAPRHLYHFDSATLRQILAKTGFMVEKIRCDFIPGNFLLDLDVWRERTGRRPVRHRLAWKPVGALVAYASGYAGRGNCLVAFARKPA